MLRLTPRLLLLLALLCAPVAYAKHHSSSSDDSSTSSSAGKSSSTPSTHSSTKAAPKERVHIAIEKRDVPSAVKSEVYKESGIPKSDRKNYVIDHRVPLELGGSNGRANLQAEPKAEARVKDKWENYLAAQVRAGKITLEQAQAEVQRPHSGPPPK